MDSKKLAKIIKLIIEQELKRQLPALIKEGVTKVLNETKTVTKKKLDETIDPFELATSMLLSDRETVIEEVDEVPKRRLSTNPVLNKLLNETTPFSPSSGPINEGTDDTTISMGTNMAQAGMEGMKAKFRSNMGLESTAISTPNPKGLNVETGNPAMNKALNRDYSELVRRFKK